MTQQQEEVLEKMTERDSWPTDFSNMTPDEIYRSGYSEGKAGGWNMALDRLSTLLAKREKAVREEIKKKLRKAQETLAWFDPVTIVDMKESDL